MIDRFWDSQSRTFEAKYTSMQDFCFLQKSFGPATHTHTLKNSSGHLETL